MKNANAMTTSPWTTGANIAIGTNVDVGALILDGTTATSVTLVAGGVTVLNGSGASLVFSAPLGVVGALTGTSSGGSFTVVHRKRNS